MSATPLEGLVSVSLYAYNVSPVVANAKFPEIKVRLPQVPLLQVSVNTSGDDSVITTTFPFVIILAGEVHRKTTSPELNNKVLLSYELSVK